MNTKTSISYFIFIYFNLFLLLSCKQQNGDSKLLKDAYKLTETNPSLALKLIDSIYEPEESLTGENYMLYLITKTQLHHKNYISIEDDSLIFKAVAYFKQKPEKIRENTLANYYAGTVLRQQKKNDQAIEWYKIAETYGKKTEDHLLNGLINFNIADLLSEQGQYGKALFYYERSSQIYRDSPEKQSYCFSSMGRMYLFNNKTDSAFIFFHKGLKIAERVKNKNLKRQLAESLSVAYEQIKNYEESKKYLYYSLSFNTDSTKLPRYNLNFALLYDKMQLSDSVRYYVYKLTKDLNAIKDNYLHASILNFLIDYEKRQKNLVAAFDFQSERIKVITQIMKERESQSVYKIERKYNYEQAKKEYFKSISIKQRWIIILMGTIFIGVVSFIRYTTRQRNKQITIQNRIETLTEMNNDLGLMIHKKQLDLRKELLWRFDITKKFLRLNEEINKKAKPTSDSGFLIKKFNHIVYGQGSLDEQWDTLHEVFKQARPNYSEKIKQLYPEISETEFRICVLTYANFSVKEIALILQQSPNTIQTRRTSLRKKLGVPNGGSIADSIDRILDY